MANKKGLILLAEDDLALGYVIEDNLVEAGYGVVHFTDGQSAIDGFDKSRFDLCLLDVMMPNKDGFAVAKKIRQQSDVMPILFITARSLEEDRIKGFQTGADDYIIKPFSMQELMLRMEVFLRRNRMLSSGTAVEYKIGNITFRPANLQLVSSQGTSTITQREADLLLYLCENPNRILKREEILLRVWGKDDYFLGRSMDVFMTKVRKHLKADLSIVLETIHGIGFRLNAEISSAEQK